MSLERLKQLFMVGALGVALVGCSSTPTDESAGVSTSDSVSQTSTGAGETASLAGQAEDQAAVNEKAQQIADAFAALHGKRVHFDFDRSEVKSEFHDVIKLHADYLSINPDAKLTVEGHCDERGSREYNLALGERRANAIKNALIAEGVEPARIDVISFGEDRPLVEASNTEAWAQNRRGEFVY
ncbi:MAG: peptidoglycan-associated lipoprotein Pal [Thiomicrospira sp.]|uniref:peptidoglycan-associated lipoprotein Pal n=1 Tax=Thiomicrospira sp. TaxID=935 RepID=UPI001A04A119|nr:peptidoglycan-associated lipoprotein Pal [Thiomicrospira sp.]MBE0494317.1 peptidoglycan-associated lipoprotein Pal [Thiomicrospira sp.]